MEPGGKRTARSSLDANKKEIVGHEMVMTLLVHTKSSSWYLSVFLTEGCSGNS